MEKQKYNFPPKPSGLIRQDVKILIDDKWVPYNGLNIMDLYRSLYDIKDINNIKILQK
jgi:hypothetical protein